MGLVGPGFVGMHHIDAVRRLGFVDVVAIADADETLARAKADALGVPKAYGSFEALAADPDVHVVHNTTPNFLHGAVIGAALAHHKHIVSEKPLASSGEEAHALWLAAREAGVVHAVTFNYRGNPMVQQARAMIAAGDLGAVHYVHGALPARLASQTDRFLTGVWNPTREAPALRWPISALTGAILAARHWPAYRVRSRRSRQSCRSAIARAQLAKRSRRQPKTAASRFRSQRRSGHYPRAV